MAEIPKIVIRTLASGEAELSKREPHVDPNVLTAFAEQSLGSGDRLQVLNHLAQCFECREIVSLAAPELIETNVLARPTATPWFAWPVLRWGAAIACVVVVGTAVTLRQRETRQPTRTEEAPVATSVPASSNPQPAAQSGGSNAAAVSAPASAAQVLVPKATQSAKASVSNAASGSTERATKDSLVPGRAKEDLAETQPGSGNAEMATAIVPITPATSAPPKQLPHSTLMGVPRWTLTSDGTLQRSLDLGRSWEPVTVSLEASLHALAANGFDIWVGGTMGALYHSDDAGEHWMKVQPFANGEPLTADIIGVEFPDAQQGRLTTTSGEVWMTGDAGLTWQETMISTRGK
jgi:hypothetical protein